MTHAIDAMSELGAIRATPRPVENVVALSRWLSPADAADALGISLRALQYRAGRGEIERRKQGRRTLYRVDGRTQPADASLRQSELTNATTDARNPKDALALLELRDLLAAAQTAQVDAERRAAVAEYRAKVAETDPGEVQALRARIAELEAQSATLMDERNEARAGREALAEAMRKRHGFGGGL